MAKDIQKIIRRIQDLLNQSDMTDIKQFADLANAYGEFCQFYLENCQKVQELLDRKMYIEAAALAESFKPPLPDQYAAMQFPGLDRFLQVLSLYNLPLPAKVDASTLTKLQAVSQQTATYQPLLDEYRKIARGPNLEAKILILRKLLPLLPDNQAEWQKTLLKLENEQLDNLTQQAQRAIETQDYGNLAELHAKFLNPGWQVKPRSEVLAKIKRELDSEYLRQQALLAEELLSKINHLYSLGTEHAQLGAALREWEEFCNTTTWDIPEDMINQVSSARQFWQAANDALEKEQAFQRGLVDLGIALDHDEDLQKVDKLYFTLTQSERDIPAAIQHRYKTYCVGKMSIQRRRRLLGYAITICVCMLLAGAAVILFNYVSNRHLVNSYRSRLDIALQEPVMDQALAIKAEIERKYAKIMQHPIIHTRLLKLAEQEKAEGEYRTAFVGLARQIREGIPFYAERLQEIKSNLAAAEKTLVGKDQQAEYQVLSTEVQDAHEKYLRAQEKSFIALYEKQLQEYQQFKLFLLEHDDSACRATITNIRNLMEQAQKMPDVPASLRSNYEYQDRLFENMPNELEEHNKNHSFILQCGEMHKILQDEIPEAEKKDDEKQLQVLLQKIDEIEAALTAEVSSVSDSSKNVWENLQAGLKEARQALKRLEGKKEIYEKEYQSLWRVDDIQALTKQVSEYLQKYPFSPYVEELKLFQKQQIARFEAFSHEQFWDKIKSQIQIMVKRQAAARQRVQQALDELLQESQRKPLKMLAFGSLEFYFSEPVNMHRDATILYLTDGLPKKLTVKVEGLHHANKKCEFVFDGRTCFEEATYPQFFEGMQHDFVFPAPHQKIVRELQEKLVKIEDGSYWAGDFLQLCLELISPTKAACHKHDIYKRAVALQKILSAYLKESSAEQSEFVLPQETSLQELLEKLQAQMQELPSAFHKKWLTASHNFTDSYKKFQENVGKLYYPVLSLKIEKMMREAEALLTAKYLPVGIVRSNERKGSTLFPFSDDDTNVEYPLLLLDENGKDFTHVADYHGNLWSRNERGQELLRPGHEPMIVYRLLLAKNK